MTDPWSELFKQTAPEERWVRLTRRELYDLIWARPMTAVAADFGMSSVALAKHARKLGVPCPGRGYWQQLAAGEKPKKPKLPPATKDTPEDVTFGKRPRRATTEPKPQALVVPVPAEGSKLHPMAQRLKKLLHERKPDEIGLRQVRAAHHAVLKLSSGTEERGLRILTALLGALDERGQSVRLTDRDRHGYVNAKEYDLQVFNGDDAVSFGIVEKIRQTPHVLTAEEAKVKARGGHVFARKYDQAASGVLHLELHSFWDEGIRKRWADAARTPLDAVLGEVVVGLEAALANETKRRRQRAEEEGQREARRRQEEARERQRKYEEALAADLVKMATSWREADTIRSFLAEVERRVPSEQRSPGYEAWLAWAREYAESIDPLSNLHALAKDLKPKG
jgi:hypothetical protein